MSMVKIIWTQRGLLQVISGKYAPLICMYQQDHDMHQQVIWLCMGGLGYASSELIAIRSMGVECILGSYIDRLLGKCNLVPLMAPTDQQQGSGQACA